MGSINSSQVPPPEGHTSHWNLAPWLKSGESDYFIQGGKFR